MVEADIGYPLLIRDGRNGVHPTPAGEFVLAWARVVLSQKKETFRMARAIHDGTVPPLRLGFSSFVNGFLLDNFRIAYQGMFPDCEIQLFGGESAHILERLEGGSLDCALLPMPIDKDLFNVRQVAHSPLVICMRADDALSHQSQVDIHEAAPRLKVFRDPDLHPAAHSRLSEMFSELGIPLHLASSAATPADIQMEAQHLQLMGDTGVGKTQLIMQCLRQIRGRGDSAIIYDPACEYIQRFYDSERGDIVLNPLDARCPYWGPAQELESEDEAYAIATSLYAPKTDKVDEFFHETPAQIFAHLLKRGPTPHQLAAWMSSDTELMKMVDGTEMAFYIDRKAGPQRAGVLSSLGLVAKSFRMLPERDENRAVWNARTWSKTRRGWIFITSRPPERDTFRPLHSLWIDLLVMRLLTAPQPGQKPVWFVIDELASLQRLPHSNKALTSIPSVR